MKTPKLIIIVAVIVSSLISQICLASDDASIFDRVSNTVQLVQDKAAQAVMQKADRAAIYAELAQIRVSVISLQKVLKSEGASLTSEEQSEMAYLLEQSKLAIDGLNEIAPAN